MITRVLLVIALLGCLALAQNRPSGNCVCRRTREVFGNPKAIQDIQIYPSSHTCDKMEIVVLQKNGIQYCLDPKMKKVQELIRHLLNNRNPGPTASPEDGSADDQGPV
ncbi:interleukin-8-like isoform X1 [Anguilla anguilla]|uniref:interleukin-8-like isoform X1 n=1 Tax=Anguilla anguilla TaxID=7936 RepID=UPI0015B32FBA|nr:interleukin-8-like isoform X1 [Anguilla anguilla]